MATIIFSDDFMFGTSPSAITRITKIGDGGTSSTSSTGTTNKIIGNVCAYSSNGSSTTQSNTGELVIMTGTMPASASILTSSTAPVGTTLLISYNWATHGAFISSSILGFSSPYVAATGSGTATWFWFRTRPTGANSQAYVGTTVYHHIIGSVGGPTSGADLEISSTNIVAGNIYRINRLKFTLPTTFTY